MKQTTKSRIVRINRVCTVETERLELCGVFPVTTVLQFVQLALSVCVYCLCNCD